MSPNPSLHALAALAYIITIVSTVFLAPHAFSGVEEHILYPMVALSLLVLSVATMAYLFFYQPLVLLLAGKPTEGAQFFLKTLATFALGTIGIIVVTFFVAGA